MCVASKGTQLQITIASVLTTIGYLENVEFPKTQQDLIRCQDLDDTYESIHSAGSAKGGQVSGSLYYDPADTVHQRLVDLVHEVDFVTAGLTPADRKIEWRLNLTQYSTPKTWDFDGIATQFDVSAAVAEALKASLVIEVEKSTALPA